MQVLTNAVGGLAECAKFPDNRTEIRTSGGIPKLIMLLSGNNGPMLENVCHVLGECANDTESMDIIHKLDGVRLIWSQLKHPSPAVQASVAWALCPCIQNARVMKQHNYLDFIIPRLNCIELVQTLVFTVIDI